MSADKVFFIIWVTSLAITAVYLVAEEYFEWRYVKNNAALLKDMIVPKFNVGQTVFVPITGKLPQKATVIAIHCEINELPPLQITYDVAENGTLYEGIPESYIFAPREKTEKALAEGGVK